MLSNTIQKGKRCGKKRHRFSVKFSQEVMRGNAAPSHPQSSSNSDRVHGGGWKVDSRSPALLWQRQRRASPSHSRVCVENPQWLFFQSFRLKQTVCIEKIPAHLVSFLLLLASARTICGIKCHALMDRREKKMKKRTKEENEEQW